MSSPTLLSNRVHTRVVVRDDEASIKRAVHCKRRGELVTLDECARCPHAVSLPPDPAAPDAVVNCWASELNTSRADVVERAARTPLGAVMRGRFACVGPSTSWETLESLLLDDTIDAVPVVDEQTRPIGIVSKSDLLRNARDRVPEAQTDLSFVDESGVHVDVRPDAVASEVMTPLVHALPEGAPLSFAVALLALEDIDQIPVVSSKGEVVGLLAARDALRWFAHEMGYLVRQPGV